MENNYDFRQRMAVVHKPNRRDITRQPLAEEVAIDDSWCIVIDANAGALTLRTARDFQDYLLVSMGVSVQVKFIDNGEPLPKNVIHYTLNNGPDKKNACRIEVTKDYVELCGADETGLFRGSIFLEDTMNLREAPFLPKGEMNASMLYRQRSVHSGIGIDDFPDEQLNAIAHAGFTCIEIFVKGPNETAKGQVPLNDIIARAHSFGLECILYCLLHSYKHPDDADADAFFDSVYGEIFRQHPGFDGIILVGESLDFPSKDPHVCLQYEVDGIHSTLPKAGWYPCCDYPAYIQKVCNAIWKVKPGVEIIFNTYNIGFYSKVERRKFLAALPQGITIQITYDIFGTARSDDGLAHPLMDYSISADKPGEYFVSEVENAYELGRRHMRCTSNLAGATWDFGTVPYVPVPQRWATRMKHLRHYLQEFNVDSFYDCHHYGWWPNPCNELAKAIFAENACLDTDLLLRDIARRDYGEAAADGIVKTWQTWSNSMDYYVGTNEDQYGPWRTGPAYPFIFQPNISRTMANQEIKFPTDPRAHFGYQIIKTFYTPYENSNQSPGPLRFPGEIRRLETMLKMWNEGLTNLEDTLPLIPENKRKNGIFLHALGKFIRNSIVTTLNIKRFWLANIQLQNCSTKATMLAKLDEITDIANKDILNVKDSFACVQTDSRLGWEPSMEYVCDEWHLNWKLRQMDNLMDNLRQYREMVLL